MNPSPHLAISRFVSTRPTDIDWLRGIVLFGQNSASYKFALAKSIVNLSREGHDAISLQNLALPFALEVSAHLKSAPRQGTSKRSKFLESCRKYNAGEIELDELRDLTVKHGFENVIDAFHVLGNTETTVRFFLDERKGSTRGIRLTESLVGLKNDACTQTIREVESRWRLVETAWDLGLNRSLITFDETEGLLIADSRRVPVTSARDALNGYQKGQCFYCYRDISTIQGHPALADVDHLIPHALQRRQVVTGLDGVWNLVLACKDCNRGPGGKFDSMPNLNYLDRLAQRNDFLISSHHPLRETLMLQTGQTPAARTTFLQSVYDTAKTHNPTDWQTVELQAPRF